MNADHVRRARKALSHISQKDVKPFIDVERLVRSEIFAEMVDMAVEHGQEVGNLFYVNALLDLVTGTKHELALLDWVSIRIGVSVAMRNGRQFLKKAAVPTASVPLERIFPAAVAAQRAARAMAATEVKLADPELRVVEVRGDDYVDMLDSRARLPGSFGTGRRR